MLNFNYITFLDYLGDIGRQVLREHQLEYPSIEIDAATKTSIIIPYFNPYFDLYTSGEGFMGNLNLSIVSVILLVVTHEGESNKTISCSNSIRFS